jgi:hypothetical protein
LNNAATTTTTATSASTTTTTELSKLELRGEREEVDIRKEEAPLSKYDYEDRNAAATYNETLTFLNEASKHIDEYEQKEKKATMMNKQNNNNKNNRNNPNLAASPIQQTASARNYYRDAAFKHFTETADAKFWETVEKRRKWK